MNITKIVFVMAAMAGILSICGCYESYATPQAASMRLFEDQTSDSLKNDAAPKTPNLQLPVTLAIARIQSRLKSPGFYIINNRVLESKIDLSPIRNQEGIRDIVMLNSLLASGELSSASQLHTSAKSLKADALLVYTIDTQSEYRDNASVVSVFTLGLAPTIKVVAANEASAKMRLYGIKPFSDSASWGRPPRDPNMTCTNYQDIHAGVVSADEYFYPSLVPQPTEKRYCWSALVRRADPNTDEVQTTVFVCRILSMGTVNSKFFA